MTNLVLTDRDVEILKMVSRVGFLTEKQICTLFYSKHKGFELDMTRARGSLSKRIYQLVAKDLLAKSTIPESGTINRVAYLLGRAGAQVLKDNREIESRNNNNWLSKKSNDILIRSRHDLIATNFLVNLIMLSRRLPEFNLVDWLPDRDCRFYIPGDKKRVSNPDLYLSTWDGGSSTSTLFIEVDRGTLDRKSLRVKIRRSFEYYVSRKYQSDLGETRFPRLCFLAPENERLQMIMQAIRDAKVFFSTPAAKDVMGMPFWLTTFDEADVHSIDRGFISHNPLEDRWTNELGEQAGSPLLP
ncbi:MAG: replication-relaxation family protein [Actinobacteria bacterium]|nr:replication-relaxation family protein [Actinomycetota bacterium]